MLLNLLSNVVDRAFPPRRRGVGASRLNFLRGGVIIPMSLVRSTFQPPASVAFLAWLSCSSVMVRNELSAWHEYCVALENFRHEEAITSSLRAAHAAHVVTRNFRIWRLSWRGIATFERSLTP